jgi:hypothetical protein
MSDSNGRGPPRTLPALDGGHAAWLTAAEAARALGLPEDTFLDLVDMGTFPAGERINRRTIRWPALTIAAAGVLLAHLLALARRQGPAPETNGLLEAGPR